jgi:hypothetical protein
MSKKKKKQKIWVPIFIRVISGEKNIPSPFVADGIIESLFVIIQKENKMGYGRIWCSKTLRGIHLSRMGIPDTVRSVFAEEVNNIEMPDIKIEPMD